MSPVWSRRLLVLMAVSLLLAMGIAGLAMNMEFGVPLNVTIDGEEVVRGFDLTALPPAHKVVLAGVVMIALLSALVIVPLALVFAMAAVLGVVLLVVGVPLVAALAGVALLLSPLILLGWLLWKLIAS